MSLEKNIERIADALEALVNHFMTPATTVAPAIVAEKTTVVDA